MKKTQPVAVAAAVVVICGLGAHALAEHASRGQSDSGVAVSVERSAPTLREHSATRSVVSEEQPCELRAVPALAPDADPRLLDALATNPASQSDPSEPRPSESEVIAAAREMSSSAQASVERSEPAASVDEMPAAAAEVPYRVAMRWLGIGSDDTSIVAPVRCVWVVTVHAPFEPRSRPDGRKPPTYDSYTAVFDVLSGDYLAVGAGTNVVDVIVGTTAGPSVKEYLALKQKLADCYRKHGLKNAQDPNALGEIGGLTVGDPGLESAFKACEPITQDVARLGVPSAIKKRLLEREASRGSTD